MEAARSPLCRDLGVQRRLVIAVVGERYVDLGERQVWALDVDLLGAPSVGKPVQHDVGVVDPGDALFVQPDVWVSDHGYGRLPLGLCRLPQEGRRGKPWRVSTRQRIVGNR